MWLLYLKSHWQDQKTFRASASSFSSAGWDSSLHHENLHWNSLSWRFASVPEWIPAIRSLVLTIFLNHLPQEMQILLFSELSRLLLCSIFGDRFLTHPSFPILQYQLYQMLSFPNSPWLIRILERYQVILSFQNDQSPFDHVSGLGENQPLRQKGSLGLWMILRIVFRKVLSRLPGDLGYFADDSIPWNQPTIFRPSRIATEQQTFFLKNCGPLCQQSH